MGKNFDYRFYILFQISGSRWDVWIPAVENSVEVVDNFPYLYSHAKLWKLFYAGPDPGTACKSTGRPDGPPLSGAGKSGVIRSV